ncbi:MAG: energy transducer TonB [Pseudomonadota bacterium]|nr:energy transducer TonB [Pseudomonadota bacterium]
MSRIFACLRVAAKWGVPLSLGLLLCVVRGHAADVVECKPAQNSNHVRAAVKDASEATASGQREAAIASLLDEAEEARKGEGRTTLLLTAAFLQLQDGQLDEAHDTLSGAMQAAPFDSATRRDVRELMAQVLSRQGRYQEVVDLYDSTDVCVVDAASGSSYSYAAALLKTGQLDRANELATAQIGETRQSMKLEADEPLYVDFQWQVLAMYAQCALQKRTLCLESWRDLYRIRDMNERIPPALSFMLPHIRDWPEAQVILPENVALDRDTSDDKEWAAAAIMRDMTPAYPSSAVERGQEGWVLVGMAFDRDGHVTDVEVLNSRPEGVFDIAALRAAKRIVMMPSPDIPVGETRSARKLYLFKMAQ